MRKLQERLEAALRERPRTTEELVQATDSSLYDVLWLLRTLSNAGCVFQYAGKWELK